MPSRTPSVSTVACELQTRRLFYPRRRRYRVTPLNRHFTDGNEGGAKVVGEVLGSTHNEGCIVVYFNMTGRQESVTDKPLHC
jgi:hypothetical protein